MLLGTLAGDMLTGTFEAQGGRASGGFQLIRVADLESATSARYHGAYRFADGRMLLIDGALGSPDLMVTDPVSGRVRMAFPKSTSTFFAGPALRVPFPTDFTLTFEFRGTEEERLVRTSRTGVTEEAIRVPLKQEQISFRNGDVTLAGSLLLPPSPGPHPALVFTHGGGAAVREWFWGLGYLLATRGFAVLAFDKRGAGASSGSWRDASFEELADDAVAAGRVLQSRPEIDSGRIGFWGLSQGAWIAPLAAVRMTSAAFVVTLSGGGLTPERGELLDSEWELRRAGFPDQLVEEAIEFQLAKNRFMRTGSESDWEEYAVLRARAAELRPPWYLWPGTDLSGPDTADSIGWTQYRRSYFYDPVPTLRLLKVPVLVVFGELDTPEGVAENVASIAAALAAGGNQDFSIRTFPNGRHNLMDMSGAAPNDYARLQRFVPRLFEGMVNWLEERAAP
ncbi:MAG: alpha/beta fold hydrolase [Acidobacteria bacterium]|nr:alpha/beta fold hydrolase [Acidobacteriota bacterium]